jgi:hypothetical protein
MGHYRMKKQQQFDMSQQEIEEEKKKGRKETGLYACLVNWACCWAKKVVQAFATLAEKSVTASTVLL